MSLGGRVGSAEKWLTTLPCQSCSVEAVSALS